MISVLTLALAPTFFVMLLGYTAGRAGVVNNMHVAELNTVVMGYALPASLLVATASTPRSALIAQWPVLVSPAAVMMGTLYSGTATSEARGNKIRANPRCKR